MNARKLANIVIRCAFALLCCLTIGIRPTVAAADLGKEVTFDIPAQQLPSALLKFATQSGVQITSPGQLIEGKNSAGVMGTFDGREALQRILQDTELRFDVVDENTVMIVPLATQPPKAEVAPSSAKPQASNRSTQTTDGVQKKSFWDRFRVAQVDQGKAAPDGAVEKSEKTSDNSEGVQLEEIVVTAQKRVERLHDVPVPVTAISGESLIQQNQLKIIDYYTSIPGLNADSDGYHSGVATFAIRGITTGGLGNPTVGIMLDDIPLGASTIYGGGYFSPDLDPADLARIELLRGPQGTLYGANSMGGLLKYVAIDPSTDRLSGRVELGGSSVGDGGDPGYNARASVNIPVSDTFAFRVSGFTRTTPGYIDNVTPGIEDVNEERADGGRISALARLSEAVTLKLSALLQDTTSEGSSYVDLGTGLADLQQEYARGVGGNDQKYRIYSATLQARLGSTDLALLSSYRTFDIFGSLLAGSFAHQVALDRYGASSAAFDEDLRTTKFSQEVRLSVPVGERIQWLFGGVYTRERSANRQLGFGLDPVTGVRAGEIFDITFPTTYKEIAGFTDLTYQFTDRFDVQFGVRVSEGKQTYQETDAGLLFDVIFDTTNYFNVGPTLRADEDATTYLFTPRFKVSPNLMTYARIASGFRPGGANSTGDARIPKQFDPDETKNYEVGVKGDFMDRTLSFDASLYYIDWKDIQLFLVTPDGFAFFDNASRAKSQGIELSVEARPRHGTTLGAWIALSEVELTEALPPFSSVQGPKGARLPGSTRVSGYVSLNQEFSLTDTLSGYVGGALSYVGDRQGLFTASGVRSEFPSYVKLDLNAGARYESWGFNLYVNNLTDKRGVVGGGLGGINPNGFILTRPRTIGISLSKTFD